LLARLLADRGDLDGATQALRTRAAADKGVTLGDILDLFERTDHDLDKLQAKAYTGDTRAARLLADRGGLRALANAGDTRAAIRLARRLADRGDLDGAVQVLRTRARFGDTRAALSWPPCWPTAASWTGPCRSGGPWPAPTTPAPPRLAFRLADRGDADGLRSLADAGDGNAGDLLAGSTESAASSSQYRVKPIDMPCSQSWAKLLRRCSRVWHTQPAARNCPEVPAI
jgi:hypothetical protein